MSSATSPAHREGPGRSDSNVFMNKRQGKGGTADGDSGGDDVPRALSTND
jgi:hypothetical protein